jgi:hypothetical protein
MYLFFLSVMGCGAHKSSKKFLNKADLIELQKYPEELHEKRIKILKWMEDDMGLKTAINEYDKINWKKLKENEQLSNWQEGWHREQELVKHPSLIDSCESKMPCITLIDEDLRLLCDNDAENFWKDLEQTNVSS